MRLKETITEQIMLKTKEKYGCDNLKLIHLGKGIDDNVIISQQFTKKYENKVLLLGIKSPAITNKSNDTIAKASPPMINKIFVVKSHIGLEEIKSHKCVDHTLKGSKRDAHEDREKNYSVTKASPTITKKSTKKILDVKSHIDVKEKKSHKCVNNSLKDPDKDVNNAMNVISRRCSVCNSSYIISKTVYKEKANPCTRFCEKFVTLTGKKLVLKSYICVEANKAHKYIDNKLKEYDKDINKGPYTLKDMHVQIKKLTSEGED